MSGTMVLGIKLKSRKSGAEVSHVHQGAYVHDELNKHEKSGAEISHVHNGAYVHEELTHHASDQNSINKTSDELDNIEAGTPPPTAFGAPPPPTAFGAPPPPTAFGGSAAYIAPENLKSDLKIPPPPPPPPPPAAAPLTPEEIIQEVGSADLRDIFRRSLEGGVVLRRHTEFGASDLKIWVKRGEPVLRYKRVNAGKLQAVQLAYSVDLEDLLLVQRGKDTNNFILSEESRLSPDENCFTLLWKGGSLDVSCPTEETADALVKGFELLIKDEPVLYGDDLDLAGSDSDEDSDHEDDWMDEDSDSDSEVDAEDVIDEELLEHLLQHFVQALQIGVRLVIHSKEGSSQAKMWINKDKDVLWWRNAGTLSLPRRCRLEDIMLLKEGKTTTAFLNPSGNAADPADCFSLLVHGGTTLNLEIPDDMTRMAVIEGFKLMIKTIKKGNFVQMMGLSAKAVARGGQH